MSTIFRIVERESHDMNIFITERNHTVTGLNYHFGIGHIDKSFYTPDPELTEIFLLLTQIESIEERIYAAIDIKHKMSIKEWDKPQSIEIPDAQLALVRRALKYYSDCIDKFADVKTMSQEHQVFDLMTLEALFHYNVSVVLTEGERNKFTAKHGVDLPLYNP